MSVKQEWVKQILVGISIGISVAFFIGLGGTVISVRDVAMSNKYYIENDKVQKQDLLNELRAVGIAVNGLRSDYNIIATKLPLLVPGYTVSPKQSKASMFYVSDK